MKYCGLFDRRHRHNKDLDEYIISYNPKKTKELGEFAAAQQKLNKDVIAVIDKDNFAAQDFKFMGALCQKFPNLRVRFSINCLALEPYDAFIANLNENNIPYYFTNMATDWDVAQILLSYHPTDLLIGGALGFNLQKFKDWIKKNHPDVQIRAVPNMLMYEPSALKEWEQFFIRPEDSDQIYSRYIDVYELYSLKDKESAFDVYYETYALDKQWNGDLAQLIPGFTVENVDNQFLTNAFGLYRSTCDKQCQKGFPCTICPKLFELAALLAEKEKLELDSLAEK